MRCLAVCAAAVIAAAGLAQGAKRQLTTAPHGHVLTNINVWSPDGQWIVYDSRSGDAFDGTTLEQVNARTGEVRRLFTADNGANCGVVTYSPVNPRIVFILGPENPTAEWSYGFTRRRGALVDTHLPGVARPLDAMNYAPPFAAGALRGGSHVHVFSPDGKMVSFTYEDDVLARLDLDPKSPHHEPNQRNVGISVLAHPVAVAKSHPRNNDGGAFSLVVTRTTRDPRPGSDEIGKAFEEGWVGANGYLRADGSRQRRALAFQGLVTATSGTQHAEVFIVDLPEDLTLAGDSPLAGTATTRPAPPRGTVQRRLTRTDGRKFPGVVAAPRHWMRASPDGSQIAFLMKDEAGIVQLWTISPNGGEPRQVTQNATGVASSFTWSPDGKRLAHVMDGSVCITEVATGTTTRLTERKEGAAAPSPLACVFSPDGRTIAYLRSVAGFAQVFVVDVPGVAAGS
jgi:hypothetical protein